MGSSWLPGQTLDRNSAITAMVLADIAAKQDLHEGHRLWPHIQGWAEELGLTVPDAITQVSQPPSDLNRQQEQTRRQPEREDSRLNGTTQHHDRQTLPYRQPSAGRVPVPGATA